MPWLRKIMKTCSQRDLADTGSDYLPYTRSTAEVYTVSNTLTATCRRSDIRMLLYNTVLQSVYLFVVYLWRCQYPRLCSVKVADADVSADILARCKRQIWCHQWNMKDLKCFITKTIKSAVFWDMTPYSLVNVHWCFAGRATSISRVGTLKFVAESSSHTWLNVYQSILYHIS
jgi:hypothetical protein